MYMLQPDEVLDIEGVVVLQVSLQKLGCPQWLSQAAAANYQAVTGQWTWLCQD